MCGGELEITEETSVCECEYCGSKQTIPTVDDEKIMKLYDRANRLRMANEFDKAFGVYESIVQESDAEAEAYWGLLLCKYGIEYVDDPATGDKIPTCHRVSFDSILEDPEFEMVMENADALSRNVYREQAKQIEEIRKGIIEVSGKEEPYDIFICYKETADDGDRTIDSVMAQDVYEALTDKGYRVFFSRISLEDKLGTEYEPYIFAALNSAKIMLAFGTSYDYYNAVWVKNEWSRYIKLMAKDKEKHLIPCYKDIDAYDMPKEFKHLQAQDMGKVGAIQDLIRGIDKLLGEGGKHSAMVSEQEIHMAVANAIANNGNNVNALIERGYMMLKDEEFERAHNLFEDALNQNPRCAEAYLGNLLVYYESRTIDEFADRIVNTLFCSGKTRDYKIDYDFAEKFAEDFEFYDSISLGLEKNIERICRPEICIYDKNKYDSNTDYVQMFCELDNDGLKNSEADDMNYMKFKQFVSEDDKREKYDFNRIIKEKLETKQAEQCKIQNEISEKFNKASLDRICSELVASVDSLFEAECKKQQEIIDQENKKENEKWEIACEDAKNKWEKEKETFENIQLAREKENKNNQQIYELELEEYNKTNDEIARKISNLELELSQTKGIFSGSRRKELTAEITKAYVIKDGLKKPIKKKNIEIETFSKLLVLPEKPQLLADVDKTKIKINIDQQVCNVFEKNGIELKMSNIGKHLKFGDYRQNNTSSELEPIAWTVVDEEDEDFVLMSDLILDKYVYDDTDASNDENFKTSSLYKWLNEDFKQNAFTDGEAKYIVGDIYIPDKNENSGYFSTVSKVPSRKTLWADETVYWCKECQYEGEYDTRVYKLRPPKPSTVLGVRPCICVKKKVMSYHPQNDKKRDTFPNRYRNIGKLRLDKFAGFDKVKDPILAKQLYEIIGTKEMTLNDITKAYNDKYNTDYSYNKIAACVTQIKQAGKIKRQLKDKTAFFSKAL